MVRSVVSGIVRLGGMAALALGLAGAMATPAAAAGAPGPGYTVTHQPGRAQPPGLAQPAFPAGLAQPAFPAGLAQPAFPAGLAQPAFPAGLWHPGATGPGTWRPVRTPAASLGLPAAAPAEAGSPWRVQQTPNPVIPNEIGRASCRE